MLLGTTYAWFTDSVSVGINKIVSGNLDVELYHSNFAQAAKESPFSNPFGIPQDVEGEKVGPNTKLFLNEEGKEMLWEPGATCVESFRIKNEGSLALKYQFKITTANATKTPEGKTLADIINISMDEINYGANGNPYSTTLLPDQKLSEGYVFEGYLLAGEQYNFWVGLQWVPSDIDNEFNVPGGLSIDLGVTLLATQYTYEKDNFYDEDQYDKDATYPISVSTADELKTALENGKNVTLTKPAIVTSTESTSKNTVAFKQNGGIFDGNGQTVAVQNENHNSNEYVISTAGGTIQNVTINDGFRAIMINNNVNEDVIIKNVTINGDVGYAINTSISTPKDIKLNVIDSVVNGWTSFSGITSASFSNCSFATSNYYNDNTYYWNNAIRAYENATFTNCEFEQGFCLYVDKLIANGTTITLDNCTVNGVTLTAENILTYLVIYNDAVVTTLPSCIVFA